MNEKKKKYEVFISFGFAIPLLIGSGDLEAGNSQADRYINVYVYGFRNLRVLGLSFLYQLKPEDV